jgi:hypothetical protein
LMHFWCNLDALLLPYDALLKHIWWSFDAFLMKFW